MVAVARQDLDKVRSPGRDQLPFLVRVRDRDGRLADLQARAVIDASGTWTQPNPLGASGLPALGEPDAGARIAFRAMLDASQTILSRPARRQRPSFVLTSLIDIIFLLVIFFMVSSQITPFSLLPLTPVWRPERGVDGGARQRHPCPFAYRPGAFRSGGKACR